MQNYYNTNNHQMADNNQTKFARATYSRSQLFVAHQLREWK